MSKKLGLGLTLVALFALMAISVVQGADSGAARNYFPLKVGNMWMYEVTLPDKTQLSQIMGVVPYDGDTFKMAVRLNGVDYSNVHFRETEKGIFKVKEVTGQGVIEYKPEQPILPAKIGAGTTWNWASQADNLKEKVTITSLKEKVEVPAGKFETILVKSEGVDGTQTAYLDLAWYAKGVGLVKEVFTAAKQTRTVVLTRYDVN